MQQYAVEQIVEQSQIHVRNFDVCESFAFQDRVHTVERFADVIGDVTPCVTFPHEKFDELCRIMDLKQAEMRKAELMVQRLDLYAAISGQACDANLTSEARPAYESNRVIIGNMQRTSSEDEQSLIEYTTLAVGTQEKPRRKR